MLKGVLDKQGHTGWPTHLPAGVKAQSRVARGGSQGSKKGCLGGNGHLNNFGNENDGLAHFCSGRHRRHVLSPHLTKAVLRTRQQQARFPEVALLDSGPGMDVHFPQ